MLSDGDGDDGDDQRSEVGSVFLRCSSVHGGEERPRNMAGSMSKHPGMCREEALRLCVWPKCICWLNDGRRTCCKSPWRPHTSPQRHHFSTSLTLKINKQMSGILSYVTGGTTPTNFPGAFRNHFSTWSFINWTSESGWSYNSKLNIFFISLRIPQNLKGQYGHPFKKILWINKFWVKPRPWEGSRFIII